ncbi:nitrous oxide reductase family maturation protein NosD [Rummeliibacillus pycnus]|uniref:nitrous oxide reductase family maturation protein NosD n=1 Tax=Rummeliibacillus pycnus TaxID=101070 RepID=UPI0037C8A5D8
MKRLLILIAFFITSFCLMPQGHAKAETLQQLIDQTPEGGVLHLQGRKYKENVIIHKSITIKGSKQTVIESNTQEAVIKIEGVNNVKIENLTIQNAHVGIVAKNVQNLQCEGVTLKNSWSGIQLYNSKGVMLQNLSIKGIHGHYSKKGNGIAFFNSRNVIVKHNKIDHVQDGIYLENVNDIKLVSNNIQNGRYGIHFMFVKNGQANNNTFKRNVTGIMLMMSENVILSTNNIIDQSGLNASGMTLFQSKNIKSKENKFQYNRTAISAQSLTNSTIQKNTFLMNQTAVELIRSNEKNNVKENDFIGNIVNLRSDGTNSHIARNYYDDYSGIDVNGDDIGDRSYVALQSFGQWMVRQPAYQYFIESPSVVLLNEMDRQTNAIEKKQLVDKAPMMHSAINMEQENTVNIGKVFIGIVVMLSILWFWRKEIRS